MSSLRLLNQRVVLSPENGYEIFKSSAKDPIPGSMRIDLNPIALNVPERANDISYNLYIGVVGYLYFDTQALQEDQLHTTKFGTRIAYFRKVDDRMDHVFGAHFDYCEDEVGHPAFHAQFKSFADMFDIVTTNLNVEGTLKNCLENVLSTVRIPSAQLDVFSLLLQVFADHLLWHASNAEEKAAFNELLALGARIKGAGYRIPRLRNTHVELCMGARHWYPPG